jgi:hypothetical protein
MNGVLGNQISSNDWSAQTHAMLHEGIQDTPAAAPISRNQRSIIRDLEAQMQQFERDYLTAIQELRKSYVLPTDSSVLDFLNDHRALPQLLIEAAPQLKRYLGDTVFSLRVSSDEYGWQNLYADVMWSSDARAAVRLLDQFEDEWWIANSRSARGALTFTYRLV